MKLEKWNEKAGKILDKMANDPGLRFCNTESGVLFCDRYGAWCINCPEQHVLSAYIKGEHGCRNAPGLERIYEQAINDRDAILSDYEKGFLVARTSCETEKTACRKFNGNRGEVFVQEKYCRMFPKNTMFYVSAQNKPVICGIWENEKLNVIGIVLPVRRMDREFEIAA